MASDNFHFDIQGGMSLLPAALEVAFYDHKGAKAWMRDDTARQFVFYWTDKDRDQANVFPLAIDTEMASLLVKGWLATVDYGRQPDIDGSCSKGFRITNRHASYPGDWSIMFVVEARWMEHHK